MHYSIQKKKILLFLGIHLHLRLSQARSHNLKLLFIGIHKSITPPFEL